MCKISDGLYNIFHAVACGRALICRIVAACPGVRYSISLVMKRLICTGRLLWPPGHVLHVQNR
jgi:hypothetical protein